MFLKAVSRLPENGFRRIIRGHWRLCPDELRAVIIAALLPLFLSSSEYTASTSTSMDDYSVSDSSVRNVIENQNLELEHPKSEHLQDWLSGAAASFDSSELETYLLDPHSSWVDDYIRALKALPAVISLSTTGAEQKEALVFLLRGNN